MEEHGKRVNHVRKECARTTIGRGQVRCFLGVICYDWVKLFNPAGIKHRRHAWNLCAGTVLEYSTEWIVGRNTPGRPRNSRFPRDLQNRCRSDSYNLHGLNPVVFDISLHVNDCQRGIFAEPIFFNMCSWGVRRGFRLDAEILDECYVCF